MFSRARSALDLSVTSASFPNPLVSLDDFHNPMNCREFVCQSRGDSFPPREGKQIARALLFLQTTVSRVKKTKTPRNVLSLETAVSAKMNVSFWIILRRKKKERGKRRNSIRDSRDNRQG